MAEWLIAAVLKTAEVRKGFRGFEYISLRQQTRYNLSGEMPEWLIGAAC